MAPAKSKNPLSPLTKPTLSLQGPLRWRCHRLQQPLLAQGRERAAIRGQLGLLPPARHVLLERRVADDAGECAGHAEEPHGVGILVEEEDAGRQDDQELEVPCCGCWIGVVVGWIGRAWTDPNVRRACMRACIVRATGFCF